VAGPAWRDAGEPFAEAQEVHSDRRQKMHEACLAESDVSGAAEATGANAAGEPALNAGPFGVEGAEFIPPLSLARVLERLVLLLRPHGQGPARVPLARAQAAGSAGAGVAIPRRELDLDDRAVAIVDGRSPAKPRVSFGTGRLLAVPVDPDMLNVEALIDAGLPMTVRACRTEQLNGVLAPAVDQECGV
jgi:hypothetical protein